MARCTLFVVGLCLALIQSGCAIHATAKDWNGLSGTDGSARYYRTTTKVGLNFLVAYPIVGDTDVDGLVHDLTEEIAKDDGDRVRIVQGDSENYWYGFPPFTWVLTPVVHTIAAEYTPDEQRYLSDQERIGRDRSTRSRYDPTKW